jgi:hypothetical protein
MTYPKILENKCKTCNNDIINDYIHKNNTYCSKICYQQRNLLKRTLICAYCNKNFILKNISHLKKGGKYCSINCSKYGKRKYHLNESYFDSIDTEQKAYWLGFLLADCYNNNEGIIIELSCKDYDHLNKFKLHIESNHNIKITKKKNKEYARLVIYNRKLCDNLSNLECTKNKSFTIKFPKIQTELHKHLIRGFFDGDGCISFVKKYNRKTFTIVSASEVFIDKIQNILNNELNINLYKTKRKNIFIIQTNKKESIKKLFEYLYSESTVHLERKYNKFLL